VNTVPLWAQILALVLLICCSAFFSISETSLIALNNYRVKHLAKQGNKRALVTLWLLERTDRLLSLVLIAQTLLNALVTALVTAIAIESFGSNQKVLTIATGAIAFLLIVFAEITPKVIGATYPERIAIPASPILKPIMVLATPAIWFVNLFVNLLLRMLRIKTGADAHKQRLSPEELRTIVLESGNFIPHKHKSILLNLFDLEAITVEDVMTPRAQIEALDLDVPIEEVKRQLMTCYHNKLPVYEGEINNIVGILHVRKTLSLLNQEEVLSTDHFRALLTPAYFIPQDTGVFTQLQYFQENRERLAIIVDEYGEVQGLVTLEDIIEEMIGEFTTTLPNAGWGGALAWNEQGECVLEAGTTLRAINRRLGLHFPLDGPKTLNGLLLELLQDIPEANVGLKIADCIVEIVQVQDQSIKTIKLVKHPQHNEN
jgi:Mg2+/Co2+ transporter CorB